MVIKVNCRCPENICMASINPAHIAREILFSDKALSANRNSNGIYAIAQITERCPAKIRGANADERIKMIAPKMLDSGSLIKYLR
jgi:hypothetical protein